MRSSFGGLRYKRCKDHVNTMVTECYHSDFILTWTRHSQDFWIEAFEPFCDIQHYSIHNVSKITFSHLTSLLTKPRIGTEFRQTAVDFQFWTWNEKFSCFQAVLWLFDGTHLQWNELYGIGYVTPRVPSPPCNVPTFWADDVSGLSRIQTNLPPLSFPPWTADNATFKVK